LTTTTKVISQTADGMDIEDVLDERRHELDMMKEKDLVFDTDPSMLGKGKSESFVGMGRKPDEKKVVPILKDGRAQ
jgi:capsid protein